MTPITPKTFDNRLVLALVADFLTNEGYLVLHELECADYERHTRRFFRCTLDGDIPALILLSPCYRDEWTISVVLWPMESGKSAPCFETEEHTGLAYFRGWLNRWMFDGRELGIQNFHDATANIHPSKRTRMAAIQVPAAGVAEKLMRFYARSVTTAGKGRKAFSLQKSGGGQLQNAPLV